jgi:hypothetical protein
MSAVCHLDENQGPLQLHGHGLTAIGSCVRWPLQQSGLVGRKSNHLRPIYLIMKIMACAWDSVIMSTTLTKCFRFQLSGNVPKWLIKTLWQWPKGCSHLIEAGLKNEREKVMLTYRKLEENIRCNLSPPASGGDRCLPRGDNSRWCRAAQEHKFLITCPPACPPPPTPMGHNMSIYPRLAWWKSL